MGRKNLQWLHPEPLVAIQHISIIGVNNPTEKYGNPGNRLEHSEKYGNPGNSWTMLDMIFSKPVASPLYKGGVP